MPLHTHSSWNNRTIHYVAVSKPRNGTSQLSLGVMRATPAFSREMSRGPQLSVACSMLPPHMPLSTCTQILRYPCVGLDTITTITLCWPLWILLKYYARNYHAECLRSYDFNYLYTVKCTRETQDGRPWKSGFNTKVVG
jgi:hypothetical protein